ncbi:MAG: hypothetical protein AAGB00_00375 [Planctomycetota bacterium]
MLAILDNSAARHTLVVGLLAVAAVAQSGCRACNTCYDYSSPVASCPAGDFGCEDCGARSGSAIGQAYPMASAPAPVVGEPVMSDAAGSGTR